MPHLMNCSHSDTGWCLECVANQHQNLAAAQREIEKLKTAKHDAVAARVQAENDAAVLRGEVERLKREKEYALLATDSLEQAIERLKAERDEWKKECRLIAERKGCELFCRSYAELKAERDRLLEAKPGAIPGITEYANGWNDCRHRYAELRDIALEGTAALAGAGETPAGVNTPIHHDKGEAEKEER